MKNYWRSLVMIILLFSLCACTDTQGSLLTGPEHLWLTQKDQIEVLFGYSAPPNAFYDDRDEYVGLLVDYLEEIEEPLDYHFSSKGFETWDELIDYAQTHDNHIIVGIAKTEARESYLDFTNSFITIPYVVVSRQGNDKVFPQDIASKHICTVENHAVNDYLAKVYPDLKLSHVTDNLQGLREVSTGTYDAMIINQMYATYIIGSQGITNLQITGDSGYVNRLSVAVPHGDTELLQILNKALDQISQDRHQQIYNNWVYRDSRKISEKFFIILGILLVIILLSALLLWIVNVSLKRKVAEAAQKIKAQESRFRGYIEHAPSGVISFNEKAQILDVNPKICALIKYDREELLQMELSQICSERDGKSPLMIIETIKEQGMSSCECMLLLKDGREIICAIEAVQTDSDHYLAFFIDITERKKTEREYIRVQKLESISILAGGIAHDFNNLLTGIYGNIELAKTRLEPQHKAFPFLTNAMESMVDMTQLTQQLLTFSKGGDPIKEPLRIDKFLKDSALFSLRGSNTRLDHNGINTDLWYVSADRGQLDQVISNLIFNAKEAMPGGGIITLSAVNKTRYQKRYVSITCRDMGVGIDPQHIDKIFDPYFTTKEIGNGLGLASVYSIITKHEGSISVKSKLEAGTTFTILLPAIEAPVIEEEKVLPKQPKRRKKNLHILIMDDEQSIRHILSTMLMHLGHSSIATSHGEDALRVFNKTLYDRPFDLIISDLTVPGGMGGKLLVKELQKISPEVKVIVTSGYSTDPVLAKYQSYGFADRLVKPFRLKELREVLNRVSS